MIILRNFVAIDFPNRSLAKLLGKQLEGGRGGGHAGYKGLVQKPKTEKKKEVGEGETTKKGQL